MARIGHRQVIGDKHGVALQLVYDTAVPGNYRDDRFEVGIQHVDDLLRRHGFGYAREVLDVGVKNSRHRLHRFDVALSGNNRIDDTFRNVLAEYSANHLQLFYGFIA